MNSVDACPLSWPKEARLRKRFEFREVQSRGRKSHAAHYVLAALARKTLRSESEMARVGFTVTRHVGNAVARNRIKRVLREVFRKNPQFLPPGFDFVVIARQGAEALSYEEARTEFEKLSAALYRRSER